MTTINKDKIDDKLCIPLLKLNDLSCNIAKYKKGIYEIHIIVSTYINLNLFFIKSQIWWRYLNKFGQEAQIPSYLSKIRHVM